MSNPQQPELRRSTKHDATQDAWPIHTDDAAGDRGSGEAVPPDNRPGHHPEHEQDRPEALGGAGHGHPGSDDG